MSVLPEILRHNESFVRERAYEPFVTDRFPSKKIVVLSCMDTRLVELLPRAMGLGNGDMKLIKNAGAIVSHPFGSVMRSILVAVYELDATEIAVIGHHGCGMTGLSCTRILDQARARGIAQNTLDTLTHAGIDLPGWLTGFDTPESGVRGSVQVIRHHPLLPADVLVHGLLMDPDSGQLEVLIDGASAIES
jgi:carbonic anhydrase